MDAKTTVLALQKTAQAFEELDSPKINNFL